MKSLSNYTKFTPYLYFIAITIYFFTVINRAEGLTAYPILLLGIPFLWQIIKPNKYLNFLLGITFVCVSSYLIIVYFTYLFKIFNFSNHSVQLIGSGSLLFFSSLIMALWIIRNSLKESL
ncbi:hypothetical protein KFZ70_00405 [Tamlana fucoidanivorans]|uniref:DUF2069 domain-containing protein n=1 Tax=Allotamlana fucoidanivorans TaxID=2583814 RepID=A0A5C4SJ31_9FLAO|nr:hypothetical protein [Tamlana fucoidanivorans]TNJ43588.1 hypothetical protein FGF67_11800 [Tamlana fucoidanivorans]